MLLDTHAMLWLDQGILLRRTVVEQIETARSDDRLWISTISVYEMARLHERGRADVDVAPAEWIERFRRQSGIRVAQPTIEIALDAGRLPHLEHRDPLDRMLIATARYLNVPIVTRDRAILDYGRETGEVGVVPC